MLKSMTILVDTREKSGKNDHILNYFDSKNIPWKKYKIDYGDYSCMIPADDALKIPKDLYFDKDIVVERKADLDEICGNIVKERSRLEKEFTLAPANKIMIIENASYEDMVNGNYMSNYNSKSFWATYHSFWHKYGLPIVFMPDNRYTGMFIRGYFQYYLHQIFK